MAGGGRIRSSSGGDIPLTVNFSSPGRTDAGGSIAGYLWDFGDGSTSTDANPAHTYATPGNYVATVTVTDNLGAKSVNTVPLGVTAPNIPPVAVATAIPPEGAAPLSVVFTADGSYDPDGAIGNYLWTFPDGSTYYGSTAYFTFTTPGTYRTKLEVFDARGGVGTTMVSVTVLNPNDVPPLPPSNLSVSIRFPDSGRPVLEGQLEQRKRLYPRALYWNGRLLRCQPLALRGASRLRART